MERTSLRKARRALRTRHYAVSTKHFGNRELGNLNFEFRNCNPMFYALCLFAMRSALVIENFPVGMKGGVNKTVSILHCLALPG